MILIDFNTLAQSSSIEKDYLCPVDVGRHSFNNKFHENLSDPELKVLRLNDAYVDNNFFVKTTNNEILQDIGYEWMLPNIHNLLVAQSKNFQYDELFLLGGHNNYYHWLLNWLPRLFLYEMLDLKCPILVNSDFSDMQLRVLQTLFPNIKKELLVNAKKIQRVKTLHLPVFFKNPMHSPFAIRNIRNRMFGLYRSSLEYPKFSNSIFVSREKASSRKVINDKKSI